MKTQTEKTERTSLFPMTYMEKLLKKTFYSQPELTDKILTPAELTTYISRLIQVWGKNSEIIAEKDLKFTDNIFSASELTYNSNLTMLAERLTLNANDPQAISAMTTEYENQKAEHYLLTNHDISIGRMFRYMPAHWHTNDYFEIYYCFSGECPIHFVEETISMKPGTVLIIAPHVLHASPCYANDRVLFYYMVRADTFDKVFWNQLPPENLMASFFHQALGHEKHASYLQFETDADDDIELLLFRLCDEFYHPKTYSIQMLNVLMSEFFILLLRRYENTAKLPRTDDFYWKQEFSAIFSYIQSHYHDKTLSEIAAYFHYSERQITRIVYNCTGNNYSQLVLKLRMEKAAGLLKQNVCIDTISYAVGYSTTSSFYRAFTRYFHCTPVEYREGRHLDPGQPTQV